MQSPPAATAAAGAARVRVQPRRVEPTPPTNPHVRHHAADAYSPVLSFLLVLLHLAYSSKALVHRLASTLVGCARSWWPSRNGPPSCPPWTPQSFARLPHHLALAVSPYLLMEPNAHQRLSNEFADAAPPIAPTNHCQQAASCAEAIQICVRLGMAELTLFDGCDILSRSWPSIAQTTAAAHRRDSADESNAGASADASAAADSASDWDSNVVFVFQGDCTPEMRLAAATTPPPTTTDERAASTEVIVVYRGHATTLSSRVFASTSSSTCLAESDDWQSTLRVHLRRHAPGVHLPTSASMHLISFLGRRHGANAMVADVLTRATSALAERSGSSDDGEGGAPGKASSHAFRERLQRSILPLAISEPDMLLTLRPASTAAAAAAASSSPMNPRSLLAFPPWLLRVAELFFFEGTWHQLIHRAKGRPSGLEEKLREFGRTVQRGGT